ncbi:MAG: hypothetical protein KDD64_14660 [Bdellovibrionales bacterium]|nr:hypothetical protein [Bdellovibrionales bacterium]
MRASILVCVTFVFGCSPVSHTPSPLQTSQECAFEELELQGHATNVTVNISSEVALRIACSKGVYRAVGAYDGKNLLGKFDVNGRTLPLSCSQATCIAFKGELLVGFEGSGFEPGLSPKYRMTLAIGERSAIGTYNIGVIDSKNFPPLEQTGILLLRSTETPI